jgi:hypothetical protein
VNILRNRKLLAMMQERGRITINHSGDLMDWKVRYKRAPMQGYADSDTLTFSRRDRWKTAQLDWRGYAATDSMTKLERLKNKDTEAIVKVYSEIATNLMDDMDDQFGDELYIDGNAAGNTKRIHGIESLPRLVSANAGQRLRRRPVATYAGPRHHAGQLRRLLEPPVPRCRQRSGPRAPATRTTTSGPR